MGILLLSYSVDSSSGGRVKMQRELGVVAHVVVQALGSLKHKDLEFEASLSYIENSGLTWATKKDHLKK